MSNLLKKIRKQSYLSTYLLFSKLLKKYSLFLFFYLFFISCNTPEEIQPVELEKNNNTLNKYKLLVLNEGNFGNGVATLSKLNWTGDSLIKVENDAYFNVNKEYLGNVAQSITKVGNELWLVINNSQKIVRCTSDLIKINEIKGLNSPRFIAQNAKYVFVSDLYSNQISVIDKATFSVIKKVYTGAWNEELLALNNQLWIPQTSARSVLIMDMNTFEFLDTIPIAREPFAIKKDEKNIVYVLCNGGLNERETPYLYQINASTKQKKDSVNLSILDGVPSRLLIVNNEVFVLAKNIYSIENQNIKEVISGRENNFYGFAANDSYLFVTDAKDYVRNGNLIRYNRKNSSQRETVELGVIPGYIYIE